MYNYLYQAVRSTFPVCREGEGHHAAGRRVRGESEEDSMRELGEGEKGRVERDRVRPYQRRTGV